MAALLVSGSSPELQGRALRRFVRTRLVRRRIGFAIDWLHDALGQHVGFNFFAADVGEHVAIDLDTRAKHLAAFLDHLLALGGVVDDVAVFEGQIIFAHDGAHALAPAAGGFQISNNFRFVHKNRFGPKLPQSTGLSNRLLRLREAALSDDKEVRL